MKKIIIKFRNLIFVRPFNLISKMKQYVTLNCPIESL